MCCAAAKCHRGRDASGQAGRGLAQEINAQRDRRLEEARVRRKQKRDEKRKEQVATQAA